MRKHYCVVGMPWQSEEVHIDSVVIRTKDVHRTNERVCQQNGMGAARRTIRSEGWIEGITNTSRQKRTLFSTGKRSMATIRKGRSLSVLTCTESRGPRGNDFSATPVPFLITPSIWRTVRRRLPPLTCYRIQSHIQKYSCIVLDM